MIRTILNLFKPTKPDWKKPVELHYDNCGILTVTTLDGNCKQYKREYIEWREKTIKWSNYPSFKTINDESIITQLEQLIELCKTGKRMRGGWVKDLRR